jgi:hypothetical protein
VVPHICAAACTMANDTPLALIWEKVLQLQCLPRSPAKQSPNCKLCPPSRLEVTDAASSTDQHMRQVNTTGTSIIIPHSRNARV